VLPPWTGHNNGRHDAIVCLQAATNALSQDDTRVGTCIVHPSDKESGLGLRILAHRSQNKQTHVLQYRVGDRGGTMGRQIDRPHTPYLQPIAHVYNTGHNVVHCHG
jgi:hypothetical protein